MGGKLKISAILKVVTGLHIGGSSAFSPIGAVVSPIVQDVRTGLPIVPGSSLKGKMRYLLANSFKNSVYASPNEEPLELKRLFGATMPQIVKSRLQFTDAFVANAQELQAVGLREVKFENTINRTTCEANPRQIERVISGVKFNVVITYDIPLDMGDFEQDMINTAKAMRLLQIDYLGGHGTRGSGRVSFTDIKLRSLFTSIDEAVLEKSKSLFKEVEEYELLSL